MPTASQRMLDYAQPIKAILLTRHLRLALKIALAVALIPVLFVVLAIVGHLYASDRYSGVKPGMSKAQVDRYLWPLKSRPHRYNAVSPNGTAVAYEFLWYGKWTMIGVTYDASGVVDGSFPGFDN